MYALKSKLTDQGRCSWRIFLTFCYTDKKHLDFCEAWRHMGRVYVRLFKAAFGLDTSIWNVYDFVTSKTGLVVSAGLVSVWLLTNGFGL